MDFVDIILLVSSVVIMVTVALIAHISNIREKEKLENGDPYFQSNTALELFIEREFERLQKAKKRFTTRKNSLKQA